jgi:S-DNA-T family DNA segregation ATPase FtsK/SpoIIIE
MRGLVVSLLTLVAIPLLLGEFVDWCPWLARVLVRWAARRLRSPAARDRYEEEWLGNLAQVPGRLGQVAVALSHVAALPWMLWTLRAGRQASNGLASVAEPSPTDRGRNHLRASLGIGVAGEQVILDLSNTPHGSIVGTAGSGKTELMRTFITHLSLTHTPAEFRFLLVNSYPEEISDLVRLPHGAAFIGDAAASLTAVDQVRNALDGLLRRRKQSFKAGSTRIEDCEPGKRANAAVDSLPSLLVIIEEYTHLLARQPDLAEVLAAIAKEGRKLGLHLLLISHIPETRQVPSIEANLSYRIGLGRWTPISPQATLSGQKLFAMPPQRPGSGYLNTGNRVQLFKAPVIGNIGSLPTESE